MATETPLMKIDRSDTDAVIYQSIESDFDVMGAACALYTTSANIYSCFACLCFPFCYYRIKTQDITMHPKKMHLKYDNFCEKADNYLPLERIQDVDIEQPCCFRCWGVKMIKISSAGGTPTIIIGLKNTEGFREKVLEARDKLVHSDGLSDGLSGEIRSNLSIKGLPHEELLEMKQSLLRIEKLIEKGVDKFVN